MTTLRAHESCVLVIDMQTGLLPAVAEHATVLDRAQRLVRAAQLLDVPVLATEHWAEKIGSTEASMLEHIDRVLAKTHFDATQEAGLQGLLPTGRHKVLLIGTEAHVCVLQTGLGLAGMGYAPVLVADAIGSRHDLDKQAALARWTGHGLDVVTVEMAMFEWLESPAHPAFRDVLELVKGM